MANLPHVFADLLRRSAAKRRRLAAMRGAAEAGTVLVIGLATAIAIDVVVKPGESLRLVNSLGVGVLVAGLCAVRVVRPLLNRSDEVSEARAIEADVRRSGIAGGDDDLLSSAVSLSCQPTNGTAGWMVERTMALAGTRALELQPLRLIDRSAARKSLVLCSSMLALALSTLVVPSMQQLWIRVTVPWSSAVRPGDLVFTITPGDVQVVQGNRLGIEVSISEAVERAGIELVWDDGATEIRPLHRDGSLWRLDLDALAVGASYRAVTGTNASPRFRIGLVHPPAVGELSFTVTPPKYTGRTVALMPATGAVILAGSLVDVTVTLVGEPVSRATLVRFPGGEQPMTLGLDAGATAPDPRATVAQAQARFTAPQPGIEGRLALQLGIQLAGVGTPAVDTQKRWALTIVGDRPPVVALSGNGVAGGMVGRSEIIILEAKVNDDEGLSDVFLDISAGDAPPLRRRLPLPAAGQLTFSIPLQLAELGLSIGDGVSFRLSAYDNGGQNAVSKAVSVVVAEGDAAALSAQAEALRSAARKIADAVVTLGRLKNELRQVTGKGNAQSLIADRMAIAVARQRGEAVIRQVNEVAAKLPRQAAAPLGSACSAVADDAQQWNEQPGAILQTALASMFGTAVSQRENAVYAAQEAETVLRSIAERLAIIAARAEAGRLEIRTAAAGPRVGRAALILSGNQGWITPVANQQTLAMASLPPSALAQAQERFLADGAVLTGVLPSVTTMADLLDQRGQTLLALAAQAKAPADELNALLQLPQRDVAALQRSAVLAPVLATIALQAREQLDHLLAERSTTRPLAVDALARAKQQVEELRLRAESWHRQPDPQDPTAVESGTRELATVAAGVRQVAIVLKDEQQRLLQRAQAPDATLAERRSALAERRMLSSQIGPSLAAVNRVLAEVAKEPEKLRDRRGEATNCLAQLRDALSRVEPAAEGQRGAAAAQAARALLAALPLKEQTVEDPAVAARAQVLAAALRRQGDEARAKQVAEATEEKRLFELASQVLKEEEKEEKQQLTLSEDIQQLVAAPQRDEAQARLAGTALELHLAAEVARQNKQEGQAAAWERLGRDLSAELARTEGPRSDALSALSLRASALEGRQGDAARDHEIAQAQETNKNQDPASDVAADQAAAHALEALTQRLDQAATTSDQRAGARAALEDFATRSGLTSTVRAQADQAQKLTELVSQVDQARQGLVQARADQQAAAIQAAAQRQRFAELERSIAQRLATAGKALAAAVPAVSAPAPELANTLKGMQPTFVERAAGAEKLAGQVAAVGAETTPEQAGLEGKTHLAAQVAALEIIRETAARAATLAESAAARADAVTQAQASAKEAALQRAQQLVPQADTGNQHLPPESGAVVQAKESKEARGELAAAIAQQKLAHRAADAARAAEQLRALQSAAPENDVAITTAVKAVQSATRALQHAAQEVRQAAAAQGNNVSATATARASELAEHAEQAERLTELLRQAGSPARATLSKDSGDRPAAADAAADATADATLAAARDAADRVAQAAELAAEAATRRAADAFAQVGQQGGEERAEVAKAAQEIHKALQESTDLSQAGAKKATALTQAATLLARQATAEAERARATAVRAKQESQPAIAHATTELARQQADRAAAHAAAADALAHAAAAESASRVAPDAPAGTALSPAAEQAAAIVIAARAEAVAQATASAAAHASEATEQAHQRENVLARTAADQSSAPAARAAASEQAEAAKNSIKSAEIIELRAAERAAQAQRNANELAGAASAAQAAQAAQAAAAAAAAADSGVNNSTAAAAQAVVQQAAEAAADAATHADAGLVIASRAEAAAMREQLAQPLAQAWSAAALAKPGDPALTQVGDLGQEIARLVGEQEEAARLLEHSIKREESARQRLARQLAAGEVARSAVDESVDTSYTAPSSAAQAQLRATTAAAKQTHSAAMRAWERAAAASNSATRAAQAASAIRQAALPGDQNAADLQAAATAAQAIQMQNEAAGQAAQALADERAALTAATAAQDTNPADSAATRSAATGRLAALQTAATQAAEASRQQQAATGPIADQAGVAALQAATNAAAARATLLSATDGLGIAAQRLTAQLDSAAEAARQAAAQRAAEVRNAPSLSPAVVTALAAAPAALVDTAVGRALAALAQDPQAEGSFRQASATLAAAANAARSAAALQNSGNAPAAAQTLATATAATAFTSAASASAKSGAPSQQSAQVAKPSASGASDGGQSAAENGPMPSSNASPGNDQAEWAKLSERVQQAIRSGTSERFSEEHQEAIRAYYRKLGEEK